MKRIALWGLCALALTYATATAVLYFRQEVLLFHPSGQWHTTPAARGMQYEDLRIPSEGGRLISAWLLTPPLPKGSVLICHGNTGNISDRLDEAGVFYSLGYEVLLFDYGGFGKSQGNPDERGMYADARAAWDYLEREPGRPKRVLFICGRSLGAAVAAELAARVQPRGLILESGFPSLLDVAMDRYAMFPVKLFLKYRFATQESMQAVHCPTLVLHSPQDLVVPYTLGRRLYNAIPGPKRFVEIVGAHNGGYMKSVKTYRGALESFLSGLSEPG